MKRFAFRLERLLQLRQSAERERASELGVALRVEADCRAEALAGEERLIEARAQLAATSRGVTQAGTLQNLDLTVGALARESKALAAQHERSLDKLELERRQFEQARMAKRVLERLREQRHRAWSEAYNRWEQGQMDESAGQRAHGEGEL
jgi:flagellar export protein FliJ